jgi:hypothetical protein
MWQDLVLSIIGIAFTIILIPQLLDSIKGKSQINTLTSSITGFGCFLICFVDFTLGLYIAAIVSLITGIVWLLFFGLAFKMKNASDSKNV